jgi:glycerophosphoryl diester phosphodiesterase
MKRALCFILLRPLTPFAKEEPSMPKSRAFTHAGLFAAALALSFAASAGPAAPRGKPLLIAHRGASGYAPEHTLAAYNLAVEQGADFVEQDLHLTKDGALVCLHDPDLARTTDVEELFPDRASLRDTEGRGEPRRGWYAIDFTLAEIKRLDAGSWFNRANPFASSPAYAGQRVPTLEEAIEAIGDRAGLYIELKNYEFYRSLGHDTAGKLVAALDKGGYGSPRKRGRVFIQSFYKSCLLRVGALAPHYKLVQLLPMEDAGRKDSGRVTPELAREVAAYASGAGPSKSMITAKADVDALHRAGLVVHPYTFRGPTTAVARRPLDAALGRVVMAEIRRFLEMGIDGGFTDYPALWKQASAATKDQKSVR